MQSYTNFKSLFILLLVKLLAVSAGFSQIEYGGHPLGNQVEGGLKSLQSYSFSLNKEQKQELEFYQNREIFPGESMHAGFSVAAYLDPLSHGRWKVSGDSVHVWQIEISSRNALGLGIIFEDITLDDNARIFIYDPEMKHIAGSFTQKNNNDFQLLSTRLIPGETLVIEYQETIRNPGDQPMMNSTFIIGDLIHVWQGAIDLSDTKNLGSSDWCQVNVNCPEGDQWQRQKRGVARMLMRVGNSFYWCSGSLINNALQDGTPYFLTAAHCGDNASTEDLAVWQFYFNFERPGCDEYGTPSHHVINGAQLMVRGPLLEGSDFQLLYLNHAPPPQWQPYYNGWNRLDLPSNAGVGIHHPAGDAKKISTYNQTATSAGPVVSGDQMAENSTWRIIFEETETNHGVTQGGSSGSPMFNEAGLIVGTLTGGSSSCSNPSGANYYGKISYHWDQSPDPYEHLKYFLDPWGEEVTEIPGYDPYNANYPSPGFVSVSQQDPGQVMIDWYRPLQSPNNPGWHAYAHSFVDYTSQGPQRATVFDPAYFDFTFPVTITKLSHVFFQNPGAPWPNNEYKFIIYDHSGSIPVYESPILQAQSLVENIYELPSSLTFDKKFYVVISAVHGSGNPASAYQNINHGNGVSFYGTPDNWTVAGNNDNQFVYLTKIYVANSDADKEQEVGILQPTDNKPPLGNFYADDTPKWSHSVVSYKIFKNNQHIHTFETQESDQLSYLYQGESENLYDAYHVTAVYPEGIESAASNTAYLFNSSFCDVTVTEMPYQETFNDNQIPDCWATESEQTGWQTSSEMTVQDSLISPVEGDYFSFVSQEQQEQLQNHWLITPPFDITQVQKPALSFWFNAPFFGDNNGLLSAYISVDGGSFNKIWDARQHPLYRGYNAFTWIKTVLDLGSFSSSDVRFAFLVSGTNETFAAIDNLELKDMANDLVKLTLTMEPENQGEVYGGGQFIPGQTVNVRAAANVGYFFHYWLKEEEIVSRHWNFDYLMPEEDATLKAFFSTDLPSSVDETELSEDLIHIFPNPSGGNFTLRFGEEMKNVSIQIYSINGQLIQSRNNDMIIPGSEVSIDISQYPAGLYFVIVSGDQGRIVQKVSLNPR